MGRPWYVEEYPRALNRSLCPTLPTIPAASDDDQLAREAVASVERADGFDVCAVHRLRGAYDGDAEHRIALAAIKLLRERNEHA